MVLLTLLLIPTVIAVGFWFFGKGKISLGEFLLQNVAQLIILGIAVCFIGIGSTSDTEVWNGRVDKKYSQRVSCGHSYTCNCVTVSCGEDCTTTICQTCYEHSYDMDWVVKTTNNEHIEIARVNRQGTIEPPRWTAVSVGEPTSLTHGYTNYIKASPESLFRKQGLLNKYKDKIPNYPGKVFDYYKLNRLVLVNGATVSDIAAWNKDLSEMNADLGAKKKVNIITVITKNLPDEYFYALEQAWIGSKQNDFVLVANVNDSGKITWANVMAFTHNKMAEIVVRNAVLKRGDLDRDSIMQILRTGVTDFFVKRKMSDFEYLKNSVVPSTGTWIFLMILGFVVSIGLGFFLLNNDYDDADESVAMFGRSNAMSTWVKIGLGLVGVLVLLGAVCVSSVIGINNNLVQQEAGLTAQYKQNQNNYDNMVKKVVEVAQVPAMAAADLEKLTKAAISGRYGSEGSKAVFQFIQEQNPTVSTELYSKIQVVIEAGRNSFEADQKVLLDKKRVYETALNTFPSGLVAKFLGFPRIDLSKIDIVTSDRTEKAFGTKKDEAIKLNQ